MDSDSSADSPRPFRVAVIGGSYGGLSACLNLLDLCSGRPARSGEAKTSTETPCLSHDLDIILVDEREGYYHLIGSPLALASAEYSEKAWTNFSDIQALQLPNLTIIQGRARKVSCDEKLLTVVRYGSDEVLEVAYDFLIVASGLRRAWPTVPQSLRKKQYRVETSTQSRKISDSPHGVVVVGGGAVGVEMAAEIKLLHPSIKVTLVHSHDKLLSSEPLPDECKVTALRLVEDAKVAVLLNHRLHESTEVTADDGSKCQRLAFTNGRTMLASTVVMAVSRSVPSTEFLPRTALNADGYVKIQPSLIFPSEMPNSADHLAVGDITSWSGIKRCGTAMHMGYLAACNVHQLMLEKRFGRKPRLQMLDEIPPMIGLAVGRQAMAYDPDDGLSSGEEVMKAYFGDDLGLMICWNYMQLGKRACDPIEIDDCAVTEIARHGI